MADCDGVPLRNPAVDPRAGRLADPDFKRKECIPMLPLPFDDALRSDVYRIDQKRRLLERIVDITRAGGTKRPTKAVAFNSPCNPMNIGMWTSHT